MVDLVEEAPERVASTKSHGKGPVEPEAPGADERAVASWGETPVIWPNPEDQDGRARFVPDDPFEAYLWKGLEETGRASV